MARTTHRIATAAAALALTLTACSAGIVDTADGADATSGADDAAEQASTTDPTTDPATDPTTDVGGPTSTTAGPAVAPVDLPEGATWLYDVPRSTSTGGQVSAEYTGVTLPHSTGLLVACDGGLTSTGYELDGAFELLTGHLVLRDGAPEDLAVRVYLQLDGADLLSQMLYRSESAAAESFGGVDPTSTGAFDALVAGGATLTVLTQLEEGTCTPGEDPYVTFGDTYLTPAG